MTPTTSRELEQQVKAAEQRIDELVGVSQRMGETAQLRRELMVAYQTKRRALEALRAAEPDFMPSAIDAEIHFLHHRIDRLKSGS